MDIGAYGRQSDGGILRASEICRKLQNCTLNIPPPSEICSGGPVLPYVIVADEAFPLTTNIMRPYPRKNLDNDERIFNYRLSRARRIIENAFGILVAKWRIFRKPVIASVETVEQIVQASICLHNFLIKNEKDYTTDMVEREPDNLLCYGRTELQNAFQNVNYEGNNNNNTDCIEAALIRERFKDYFNDSGIIPWQFLYIL